MEKLIMNINDYKSINQASIEINKINVVSGVNGSGKSTLSRIFYSFLKGNSTQRKNYLLEGLVFGFNEIIRILDDDVVDYDLPVPFNINDTEEELIVKYNSLKEITEMHEKVCKTKIEEVKAQFYQLIDDGLVCFNEDRRMDGDTDEDMISHLKTIYLYPFSENENSVVEHDDNLVEKIEDIIINFTIDERDKEGFNKYCNLIDQYDFYSSTQLIHYVFDEFAKLLKQFLGEDSYEVNEASVQSMLVMEKCSLKCNNYVNFKLELSDNSKINPYEYFFNKGFIDNNIYYFDNVSLSDLYILRFKDEPDIGPDSPRRHVNDLDVSRHVNDLLDELFDKNHFAGSRHAFEMYGIFDEDPILEKIENIIGGEFLSVPLFFSKEKDSTSYARDWANGNLVVSDTTLTPSGIKQIGIIQSLLLRRQLQEGDYLIIDEPEVNLHPDWQFKFAEILVLLAKELGITIYINSHSPLFIESMTAFCEYYDMQDDINYYLTEPSEAEDKYDFVKINSDEIFKVYNNLGNAYDLIDQLRLKKHLGE